VQIAKSGLSQSGFGFNDIQCNGTRTNDINHDNTHHNGNCHNNIQPSHTQSLDLQHNDTQHKGHYRL